jgi:hypothetical protein
MTQSWIIAMMKGMLRHLPVSMLSKMGLATLVAPRTRGWGAARDAMNEYVHEQEQQQRRALGLDNLIVQAAHEITAGSKHQEDPHV